MSATDYFTIGGVPYPLAENSVQMKYEKRGETTRAFDTTLRSDERKGKRNWTAATTEYTDTVLTAFLAAIVNVAVVSGLITRNVDTNCLITVQSSVDIIDFQSTIGIVTTVTTITIQEV